MKVVGSHPLTDRDALPEEVLDVAGHVERRLRVQGVDRGFPQRFAVFLFQICDGHVDRSKLNHINDFVGPKIHGLCQFVTLRHFANLLISSSFDFSGTKEK